MTYRKSPVPEDSPTERSSAAPDFRALFEAAPAPYLVLAPDLTIMEANEAYLRITMTRRDDIVGRKLAEAFESNPDLAEGDAQEKLLASLEHVLKTRLPDRMPIQRFDIRRPPEKGGGFDMRYWSPLNAPVFGPNGEVQALIHHAEDVTAAVLERRRERAALRASEERFRLMLESATEYAIFATDLDSRITAWNAGAERLLGFSETEAIGRDARIIFTPEDREKNAPKIEMEMALAAGRAENERWHVRKDGSRFWGNGMMMPLRGETGEVEGFIKILRDRSEQRRAEEERERLLRHLAAERGRLTDIVESISDAFYAVDHAWRFTYVNRKAEQLWERHREDLVGRVYQRLFPQVLESESYKAHLVAMQDRRPVRVETISPILHYWVDISIYPTADGGLSVYFRDNREQKQAEQRQQLLINELNHRVKNTLATVQSIASQTLRSAPTCQQAREALEERLIALSRTHDVLTRENWEGAELGEIVAQTVEPYEEGKDRVQAVGPTVRLLPRAALALAMALQELATNAVKYGALSNETGKVSITWTLDEAEAPARLHLEWRETGGPPVQPPIRRGFGSRMIERSLAYDLGGTVRIDFVPSGVVCTVDARLA